MTIIANYTIEGQENLGPNEFTAGTAPSLNCIVQGNSSKNLSYTWSVMRNPDIPQECSYYDCYIDVSSTTSTLSLGAPIISYRAGIYTCTVSESGRPDSDNSDDFTVRVVGNGICILRLLSITM